MHPNTKLKFFGKVIPGQGVGHNIGFPTANLNKVPEEDKLRQGVYLGRVELLKTKNETLKSKQIRKNKFELFKIRISSLFRLSRLEFRFFDCLVYFGPRFVFNETRNVFEIHILDFNEDIVEKELEVTILKFIRPPKKFKSLDELKKQLETDKEKAINNIVV